MLTRMLFILLLTLLCLPTYSGDLFLMNESQKSIQYKESAPQIKKNSFKLPTGEKVFLGARGSITNLAIRRVPMRKFADFAPFYDLGPYLREINKQVKDNLDKDVIIVIKSGPICTKWEIKIKWQIPIFVLDEDCLKRVSEILEYDYTKARAGGYINLARKLIEAQEYSKEDFEIEINLLHRVWKKYRERDTEAAAPVYSEFSLYE